MISIVMPAHNEASMLEASVRDVVTGMRGLGLTVRGADRRERLHRRHARDRALASPSRSPRSSSSSMRAADYGEALRMGLLESSGEVGVVFDVDYYDLDFLKEALELLDCSDSPTGPAVVVGSKRAPGARDERSSLRRAATSVFSGILRLAFGLTLSDTHGMKALNLLALRDAVRACRSGADLFDTELIIRAEYSGLVTAEVPVTVSELRPSRTSIASGSPGRCSGWPSCGGVSVASRVASAAVASTTGAWLVIEDGVVAEQGRARRARAGPGLHRRRRLLPRLRRHPDERDRCRRLLAGDPDEWRAAGRERLEAGRHVLSADARQLAPRRLPRARSRGSRQRRSTRPERGPPAHRGGAPRRPVPRWRARGAPDRPARSDGGRMAARAARLPARARAARDDRARG